MKPAPKPNFKRLENFWRNLNPRAKTRPRFIPNSARSIYDCKCGIRLPPLTRKHCGCAGEEMIGDEYWVRLMPSLAGLRRRNGNFAKSWHSALTTSKHGEASNLSVRSIRF